MAQTPEERRARQREASRRWREKNPEKIRVARRAWREQNPTYHRKWNEKNREKRREQNRARRSADPERARFHAAWVNHRMHPEDWAALWDAQNGLCYLCGEPMDPQRVHVDHDYTCCHYGKSCQFCRRGLTHPVCNQLVGLGGDDPDRLRRIADALEQARARVAERMAERPSQLELGG